MPENVFSDFDEFLKGFPRSTQIILLIKLLSDSQLILLRNDESQCVSEFHFWEISSWKLKNNVWWIVTFIASIVELRKGQFLKRVGAVFFANVPPVIYLTQPNAIQDSRNKNLRNRSFRVRILTNRRIRLLEYLLRF